MSHPSQAVRRALGLLLVCAALGASAAAGYSRRTSDPVPRVLAAARARLGDPYVWGGTGPHSWDCSGLTQLLWTSVGGVPGMPRTAAEQQAWAVPIPAEQAAPGDLVFFDAPVTHVGLYIGRVDGVRTMIDASMSRGHVVQRAIWTSGVVRWGRVPRRGRPGAVTGRAPAALPGARVTSLTPLSGLPAGQHRRSSRAAVAAARAAGERVGRTTFDDVRLTRRTWWLATSRLLPDSRSAIVRLGVPVARSDARVGDLIVYGLPARHLGTYVGHGEMVDASHTLGRVVRRPVYRSSHDPVRVLRLPARSGRPTP